MSDTCDYCGGEATAWQHPYSWCFGCHKRHVLATYEPKFYIWMDPTPMQCAWGSVMAALWRVVSAPFPARWLVDTPDTIRGRMTAWAYGQLWYWRERAEGRI